MAEEQQPKSPSPIGEIEQGPSRFEKFLENNQKKLLLLVCLLIVGTSGWIIYRGMRDATRVKAGEALVDARDIGGLRTVIDEFSSTPAAGTAMLDLANRQWEDGLEEESIRTLREFIDDKPRHAARPSARLALATRLLERGETEEGTAILNELVTDPSADFLAPFALIKLGDLAYADGDTKAAEDYYTRARDLFPMTGIAAQGRQLITSRIVFADVEPPRKVDPPPTPEPPSSTAPGSTHGSNAIRPPLLPPGTPPHVPDPAPAPEPPGPSDRPGAVGPSDAGE